MSHAEPMSRPLVVSPEREGSRPLVQVLHDWIVTVDHKRLGIMYFSYGILFLVIGGMEASIMRAQLAVANNHLVSPETFNRLFTMHGTTMIFFAAMPIVFGFANYLMPLMVGARDMAFPRLNAWSFWMSALGGIILYFSFVGGSGLYGAGTAPDVGWFAYAPLTAPAFSVGHSTDYWIIGILVSGFGSIGTALNILTTILCMRCPGMTLNRMPLFAWMNGVMAVPGADSDRPVDRGADHAADRPLPGRTFLRHAGGRLGRHLDAFLLDLRTSRGLYPGAAGVRDCFRSDSGFLAQADLWLLRSWWRQRSPSASSA